MTGTRGVYLPKLMFETYIQELEQIENINLHKDENGRSEIWISQRGDSWFLQQVRAIQFDNTEKLIHFCM
jgi:hypothetical protein